MYKYFRWYVQIIRKAKKRSVSGYLERHHVKPLSLGGSNRKSNLVYLTYREHFLCHWLLTYFTEGEAKRKMSYALWMMVSAHKDKRTIQNWQESTARKYNTFASSGRRMSKDSKDKLRKRNIGNTYAKNYKNALGYCHTEETKRKLSEASKGKRFALGYKHTEETRRLLSEIHKGNSYNKGRKHSEETREKQRERAVNPTDKMLLARKAHSERMKGNTIRKDSYVSTQKKI